MLSMLILAFNIQPTTADVSSTIVRDSIEFSMTIKRTTIIIGRCIDIRLALKNIGESTITLMFGSRQIFDIFLYDVNDTLFSYWSMDLMFLAMVTEITLEPGETYSRTICWNFYKYVAWGNRYLAPNPGDYYLEGYCLGARALNLRTPKLLIALVDTLPATPDIHPDMLNLNSQGKWITAYIELPEGYDVKDIDISTTLVNGTVQAVTDPKYSFVTNSSEYLVDRNNDGILERMVKFNRTQVAEYILSKGIMYGNVTLTLAGQLTDGTPFEGNDAIGIIFEDF